MSKLNCLRIVNLNYNNNSMKINDEIFEFGGESTLMNLRNGGGKTVLVQMIMAPFVNKKYRDLKDRAFESYFNSQTPTYILTEWVLDGDSSYVLIGMAVRKKASTLSEEDSENSDELEIVNFIHEYRHENKFNIYNFPIVETQGKNLKVKSFGNFKKLLEELKKSKDFNFNYFDMGVSSQARNYFKTLREYKINNKEWESIIKKINMKESGLSELFQDSKSIAGLVEKWFIKAVEDKLNKDENKIRNFKDIMMKFIYQYKENEAKLEKKSAIESFREETVNILSSAEDFSKDRNKREAIENNIANLIEYIRSSLFKNEASQKYIEEELECIKLQLKEIEYEQHSADYYKLIDEIYVLEKELKIKETDKEEKIHRKEALNKQKGILECAKIYGDYKYHSSEVQKYENQLELKNAAQKDTEEERINIGFTLKEYFINEERNTKETLEENLKNIDFSQMKILKIKDALKTTERNMRESQNKLGKTQEKINTFDKVESNFNKRYHNSLARNMMGYYDENFISKLKSSYEEQLSSLNSEHDRSVKLQVEQRDKLLALESKKDSVISKKEELKAEINVQKTLMEDIERKISRRKEILKYIDVKEEKIYDKDYLVKVFDEKLRILREEEKKLIGESIKLEEETNTLKTGRTLKLPMEMENKLNQRGINILYGIDWLKKNSYSHEENLSFLEKNPFLPYSLIMEEEDIERLKSENLEVFTYNPIPIINRKKLDNGLCRDHRELCTLGEVTFYVAFNNKLLNKEELGKLLREKENELTKWEDNINWKREDIELYESLKNEIKNCDLNKGAYEKTANEIDKKQAYFVELEETYRKAKNDLENLKSSIEDLSVKINTLERSREDKNREQEEYKDLLKEYEDYKSYKKDYENINKSIDDLEKQYKEQEAFKGEKEDLLNALNNQKRDIEKNLHEVKKELYKYLQYKEGVMLQKDIEDLKARYDAITSEISKEIEEIESDLQRAREQFNKKQEELISNEAEYSLKEEDYIEVLYEKFKESETKKEIKKAEREIEEISKLINRIDKNKTAKEVESKNILKRISEDFQKDYPKPREEILEGDFSARIFNKKSEIKALGSKLEEVKRDIDILSQNLSGLDEYKDFVVSENIEINVEVNHLAVYKGKLLRNYKEAKEREAIGRNKLSDEMNKVAKIEMFNGDDFFKKSLDTLMEIIDEPENVIETTLKLLEAHRMILDQLKEDLEIIHREKDNILEIVYEYVLEVHENLGKIDKNSTIKIKGKYVKMLQIELPDWESNVELYRIRVRDFVDSIIEKALILLNDNKNIEDMLSSNITTVNLYNEVVSISSIDVKLYKIEEDRQIKISWNEVSKNSGGEGFLSAFVILSSLLSYMRRDESDIFTTGSEGKVLVMDNPFAQTNAEHLLKPLMNIARRSNTQLICFTGLGGESIYNRFDNIYVLDLKASKLKNGTEKHLISNHVKGEELVSEIISSRFRIKEELLEQMELF